MRYIISGKNIDVTEGLRTAITDKLGKLERYFTPDTEVQVTLSVEKERQKIEVTIPVKGTVIRSEQYSGSREAEASGRNLSIKRRRMRKCASSAPSSMI